MKTIVRGTPRSFRILRNTEQRTEAYLEPCLASKMKIFAKFMNNL